MSPIFIGVIGILLLFLFMSMDMNIGLAMCLSAFIGLIYLLGLGQALNVLGSTPFRTASVYTMSVVPLFILMGNFAFFAGLSNDLYTAAYRICGNLPGGLAIATTVGCAGFSATCGSSVATSITIGSIGIPEMKKYNYADSLATGSLAAGGTLGILIPPSTGFIFYSMLTDESVGALFIAGILPGILMTLLFIIAIYCVVRIKPSLGLRGPKFTLQEKLSSLKKVWEIALLFIIVIGSLYAGICTPTEAGAIGAFGAFVIMVVKRRLTKKTLVAALMDTGQITAMSYLILMGANVFGYFMAVTRIPDALAQVAIGLPFSPIVVLCFILFVYLLLGSVMDAIAMIVLTVPIFYPVVITLGFNPIWFGVIMVIVMEMALITPPVGMNVFAISSIATDVPLYTIFKGVIPFLLAMLVCLAILIFFPQIVLFLPDMIGG